MAGLIRPPLFGDEFDGDAHQDGSQGTRRLHDILASLNRSAALLTTEAGGTFTNTTRPVTLAAWQGLGFESIPAKGAVFIYNASDEAPNFWDGTGWRDAMGAVT